MRTRHRIPKLALHLASAAALAGLGGCGHSELRAPCSASEAYASLSTSADPCGPMRRVNEDPDQPLAFRQILAEPAPTTVALPDRTPLDGQARKSSDERL